MISKNLSTENTHIQFTRTLLPNMFLQYLAELTSDDAQQTNVVHKYAAFQQLSEVFNVLVNAKYNKTAWLSVTVGLQYLVQAIEDYAEDDDYDHTTLIVPNFFNYLHYSDLDFRDVPFWHGEDFSQTEQDGFDFECIQKDADEMYMRYVQQAGVSTEFFMNLCHNYIEVIMDYNSECGLTSYGNSILSMLKVSEDVDFPTLLPDVETSCREDGFEYDLDGTEVDESSFFEDDDDDEDRMTRLRTTLENLCDNSMHSVVRDTAIALGFELTPETEDTFENHKLYIVGKLDYDESIAGSHEDYIERVTDRIIDGEEEAREEEQQRLAELESRCHEAFIVTLIEMMSARKFEPLKQYGFDKSRLLEITGGNSLPIYPDFYTNVANIISTFTKVPTTQIRMILEPEFFAFSYMDRSSDMELL